MNQSLAYIDLTAGAIRAEKLSRKERRLFLGGRGINAYLLFRNSFTGMHPLAPESPFIVGAGMLSGLPCPSASRCSIGGKSPETELLGDSNIGGFFAAGLRKTGYDHLIIQGAAKHPVYLLIENGGIRIKDASELWGKDTQTTTHLLKQIYGKDCQILCIGQAGENLVRFACVRHGRKSAAGRGGLGCLMGSKKLKAIAVVGDQKLVPAEYKALSGYTKALNKRLIESKTSQALHKYGTPFLYDLHNFKGIVRTFNGRINQFKQGRALRSTSLKNRYISTGGCFGCAIACRHKYKLTEPDGTTTEGEGPEYGTLAAFGPICGINDPDAILRINQTVNQFGLDSVTTGNIIAWAIELFQNGLLTEADTSGLKLDWGDFSTVLKLVEQIAFRKGFGSVLADGPKLALNTFGKEAERSLIWTKHLLQSDSVDVRAHKGFALAVATATRGADHLRSRPTLEALALPAENLKRIYGAQVSSDPTSYEGKARMVWSSEREFALADALGICRFAQRFNSPDHLNPEELIKLVYYATGLQFSMEEFLRIGERITTLERMFLAREGIGRKDDTLPFRYFEPMPVGRYKGEKIEPQMLDLMLDEYYQLHGWDQATGIPLRDVLRDLELDFAVPEAD